MRLPVLAALTWLAGCQLVFELEVETHEQSVELQRVAIGTEVVDTPIDVTGMHAEYLLENPSQPDGFTRVPATASGSRWTAEVSGTPSVLYEMPGTSVRFLVALPAPRLVIATDVLAHADPTPAPAGARFAVDCQLDRPFVTGDTLSVFTVGSWNRRLLPSPAVDALQVSSSFAMADMAALGGLPHAQLRATDRILVLRQTTSATFADRLDAVLDLPGFDQTIDSSITGALQPLVHDRSIQLQINNPAVIGRATGSKPAHNFPSSFIGFNVVASPGHSEQTALGPNLISGVSGLLDFILQATFANPFEAHGWKSTVTYLATIPRVFQADGLNTFLAVQLGYRVVEPEPDHLVELAGLPLEVFLDGQPLDVDGIQIPRPRRAVEVTFTADRPDANVYLLHVIELVPDPDAQTLRQSPVLVATGVEPRFALPPDIFVEGKRYVLRVAVGNGLFPGIAEGDLRSRSTPTALSILDGGVIEIVPD